ncbi:dolichol-phosphate mannosyltransferase subunit 3-like [Pomacea canaliculata]|uniref:dolichol-phosphate mannosyltransferase subunit 3-like n=1 Tax=Pomacea canaliculata TaxID=400727 RepID=UPI000D73A08F|nr:dolichol-phosphate mannosyltransferase subunit 3-like [Pomacea canaliculata]
MAIPRLFRFLAAITLFLSVWLSYMTGIIPIRLSQSFSEVVTILPLYLLISFACFSLAVVGYRVATFNDCVEASAELRRQMEEAKADLRKKGFKYANEWS